MSELRMTGKDPPRNSVTRNCEGRPAPSYKSTNNGVGDKVLPSIRLNGVRNLLGTPAAYWLASRGITPEEANLSRVCYVPAWDHFQLDEREWKWMGSTRRIAAPLTDDRHKVVGWWTQGIDDFLERNPPATTYGNLERGIFKSHGAWKTEPVLLTGGILDALSLASCGFPSIALVKRHWPEWLLDRLRGRMLYIAFTNDDEGDDASDRLVSELSAHPVFWIRLRPLTRTWNDELQLLGNAAMKLHLNALMPAPSSNDSPSDEGVEDKCLPYLFPKRLLERLGDRDERVKWREWLVRDCLKGLRPKQRSRLRREFAVWKESLSKDPAQANHRLWESVPLRAVDRQTVLRVAAVPPPMRNLPVELSMERNIISGTVEVNKWRNNPPRGACYRCGCEVWSAHPSGYWVCNVCSMPKRSLRRAG
jgi:hypothetical protein